MGLFKFDAIGNNWAKIAYQNRAQNDCVLIAKKIGFYSVYIYTESINAKRKESKMFYVISKKYEIVSRHKEREDAIKAKSETDFVTDIAGLKAMIYGPSRAHINLW